VISRPSAAGPSHRQWILLICLFVVSLPAVTTRIYSSDEIQYFAYLRSAWFDRDLSFDNEYRYFYDGDVSRSDGFHETFLERTTETGRRINFGTIGCAILWSPFYGAGHLAARTMGAPQDGFSKPYIAAVAYGSAVYGFLAIVLAIQCAQRLGHDGFLPGIAVWLGTPLVFYMYVAPGFSHACSAFAVALFIYVWLRVRDEWSTGGLMTLAAAGALMAMVREQDAFFVAGAALDFGLWAFGAGNLQGRRPAPRNLVRGLLAASVVFLAVYSPQLVAYRILNGHFGPHSSVAHKMNWAAPHGLEVLLSPQHGFVVWTPLVVLAVIGLIAGVSRKERVSACLLLMVALQVYVGGSVESWTVAGGFGQRRFVALTTVMVIGLAALFAHVSQRKLWVTAAALCVYWNLALSAEFATKLMDRQKLEPARNAYDAFVTLPRIGPGLAYRYLFDRQSFYRANPVSR
jgi:hypothetical protein